MTDSMAYQLVSLGLRNTRKKSFILTFALVLFSLALLHDQARFLQLTETEQNPPSLNKEQNQSQSEEEYVVNAQYITQVLSELQHRISTVTTSCRRLVSMGGIVSCSCDSKNCTRDGAKTVCLDTDVHPMPGDCHALSIGIGFDFSFDETLVKYGCRVTALDPTNANITNMIHADGKIQALGIGLDEKDYILVLNLTFDKIHTVSHVSAYMTYESILDTLDYPRIDLLKIDIEGVEWRALKQLLDSPDAAKLLKDVRQILLEIHLDFLAEANDAIAMVEGSMKALEVLRLLEDLGFHLASYELNETRQKHLVYQHLNIPMYRELTLVRRPRQTYPVS